MSQTALVLKAYFETLYERLEGSRNSLLDRAAQFLRQELQKRQFEDYADDKYQAYSDASLAFIDERIETYNPIGFQYLYDRSRALEAFELELELNWYDSRHEYLDLVEAATRIASLGVTDENLRSLAEDLIRQVGAFPDRSIIRAYEAAPALRKLPDYVVARAIEQILRPDQEPGQQPA